MKYNNIFQRVSLFNKSNILKIKLNKSELEIYEDNLINLDYLYLNIEVNKEKIKVCQKLDLEIINFMSKIIFKQITLINSIMKLDLKFKKTNDIKFKISKNKIADELYELQDLYKLDYVFLDPPIRKIN